MNRAIVLLGSLLLFSTAACDKSHTPSTKPAPVQNPMGFHKPDSPLIPASVQAAAKSVYQIVAPAGEPKTIGAIFGENHTLQEIINKVEGTPISEQFAQQDKDIFLFQIRNCAKSNQPLRCQIYEGDKISSAYLVGDGSRMRTAYHAVSDALGDKSITGNSVAAKVPVLVYESSGRRIWSGYASALFPKSYLYNRYKEEGQITLPNDDLADIQLSKRLGRPLPASVIAAKPGDTIYLIGFPKFTSDRAAYGVPDSPGGQLRISAGQVIPMEVASQKQGVNPADLTETTKSYYGQMVISDADGVPGLSGGVAVNASGQRVGTYTSGYPADGSATPNHISYISNDLLLTAPFKP